jgi:hypothetical protein
MSVMVINRIKLRVPVEEVAPDVEREFPATLRALPGFERFRLVKVAPDELVVLLSWATADDAAAAAAILGPGLFHTWVAPRAESQDRVVGELLFEVVAG